MEHNGAPLLSLVVPVAADNVTFVDECISDLDAQSISTNIEVILIGPDELLNNLSNKHEERLAIKVVTIEAKSIFACWNEGIRKSAGTFVSVIHPADRYRADAFEEFIKIFNSHDSVHLVYSDILSKDLRHETFEAHSARVAMRFPDYDRKTFLEKGYTEIRPVWRKSIHNTLGFFDESLRYAADLEFWLRVSDESVFWHIPEFMALRYDGKDILRIAPDSNRRVEFTSVLTYYENGYAFSIGPVSERIDRLKRVEELFGQQKKEEGWKLLNESLEKDPLDSELWVLKMRLLMNSGEFRKAKFVLNEASKRFPRDVRLANQRAIFLWREGYRQRARTVLEEIINQNPWEMEARVTLIEAYSETGDISKAVDQQLYLLNRVGDNRELYVSLIAKLLERGEHTRARYYYDFAIEKYPGDKKLQKISHLLNSPKVAES